MTLQLSVRANNCLTRKDIATIGELVRLTEFELLSWPNLGRRTLTEISDALARYGLRLGMTTGELQFEPAFETVVPRPANDIAPRCALFPIAPVAPEQSLLDYVGSFPTRERAVIRSRIVDCTLTLEQLGAQFDVTRERIRQIETRLRRRLQSFLASPDGQPARDLAKKVRTALGSAFPADSDSLYFSELFSSISSADDRALISACLLWIAGPYEKFGTWEVVDRALVSMTLDALLSALDDRGWLSPQAAQEALVRADIRVPHHAEWLRTIGFLEMDGGWLLRLSNIPDRAEQVLRYRGVPITADELLPLVDCDNVRSLRSRLLEDERFKRTSRQGHFALREWAQYDEYTGIAEEIAEEITRQGGVADTQHLIEVISQRYGVKANSVYQYLSAPMFIKMSEGRVRLRAPDEMKTVRSDPRFCPGLYRVAEQWLLRVKINSETLRGSGRALHPSVAALVGCQPGQRLVFKSPRDEIVVSWPAGSACGPNIGSLRPDVEALGGAVDDYVFLTLGAAEIGVRLLRAADLATASPEVQLALLLGLSRSIPDHQRWHAIAGAIGMRLESSATPEDVHACLMRRNEVALARLIPMPDSDDPEAIFAQLEGTLGL